MAKQLILDLKPEELALKLQQMGQPKFRSVQLLDGLYKHHYDSFDRFPTLPKTLITQLESEFVLNPLELVSKLQSRDKKTEKFLFSLQDGKQIETVLMRYADRDTVCISSQVGCPLGCVFCATGQMGFTRNLSVGEILGQVLHCMRQLESEGKNLTNIVFMGMGEPFLNYFNVLEAIDRLIHPDSMNFGARRITISTVGLTPKLKEFTQLDSQVNLAISLHAPTDELRSQLVPNNRLHPLKPLLAACRKYVNKTKRRLSFEYALIEGVNDTDQHARQLISLIKGMLCHVNLIALNPSKKYPFPGSSSQRVQAFLAILQEAGIPSSIRSRKGIEINAGCGQLAQAQEFE